MRKLRTILCISALSLVLGLAGCMTAKAYGMGRWPMYERPSELVFTPEEQAVLVEVGGKHPELFRKIREYSATYSTIVVTHNREALKVNLKQLEALNYSQAEVAEMEKLWREKYKIKE